MIETLGSLKQTMKLMSVEAIDNVIERKNALKTLVEIAKEKKRFTDLQNLFGSPATLTTRLRELEDLELIKRTPIIEKGKRTKVYYVATKKGQKFAAIYTIFKRELKKELLGL